MNQGKLANNQTTEYERSIRQVVEGMQDALYISDLRTGELSYLNSAVQSVTGFSLDEFRTMEAEGMRERIHPEDQQRYLAHMRQLAEAARCTGTPQSENLEYRWLHKDGTYHWLHNSRTLLLDKQGQPKALVGTLRDVTEQRETERALRESEASLREVLENSRDAIYRLNLRTRTYDYFSPAIEALAGYTPEEMIALTLQGVLDLAHPDDWPTYFAHTQALLESTEPAPVDTVEYRWKTKGGAYRWLSNNRRLVRDESGQPVAYVGTLRDITEHKEVEAEREHLLAEQNRERSLLETIMENTPAALAYLDRDFCFVQVNSAYMRDAGRSREELIGRNLFDLFPNTENEAIFEYVRDTGEPVRFEAKPFVYGNQPEKDVRHWDWTLVPIKRPDGRVEGLVFSLLDVTESKRLLAEVEQRAAELNATIGAISDGLVLYGPNGEFRHLNEPGERILGITAEEYASIPPQERPKRLHAETPDGKPLSSSEFPSTRALYGETVMNYHMVIRRPDGTFVHQLVSSAPIRDAQGEILGVVSNFADITSLIRLQEQVQTERARLQAVLEALPVGVFIADPAGRLVLTNQAAKDIWGHAPLSESPEAYNEDYTAWWPETGQRVKLQEWPLIRAITQGEVSGAEEMEIEVLGGQHKIVLNYARPVQDASGAIIGGAEVDVDITERKRAEQLLQRYRFLSENASDIILFINPDGHILEANLAAERAYDYSRDELCTMTIYDLRAGPTLPLLREQLVRADTESVTFETTHRRRDGVTFPVEVSSRGATIGGQRILLSIIRDITERKRAEEALHESQERLRNLNETLEQRVIERTARLRALALELTRAEERERRRLAQLLHDHLQQLLAAARISVNMVRSRMEDERQAATLGQVDDLLEESIAESRSLTAELSPPVLYDAGLAPALDWLARWMEEKHHLNVEVKAEDLGNEVPEEIRLVVFQGARELLFNVVKHAGIDRATVELRRLPDDQIELVVSDRGVGVEPSQIGRQDKGGFGLFNIRERLESLGGQMQIESEPGRGTRVTLRVPLRPTAVMEEAAARVAVVTREAAAVAAEELAAEREEAKHAAGEQAAAVRVLLADDHVIVRQGLARLLEDESGIQLVGQAGNGREAVELARTTRPDIVLMDVSMPVMDGIEATRRIVADLPNVRVIGLSMYDGAEVAACMHEAGAVDYVSKGGDPAKLVEAVRRWAPSAAERSLA